MAIELRQRANLSISELADQTGTAKNNIYWAEGSAPDRSISAKILRLVYRHLCRNEKEWIKFLLLWAIHKDDNQVRIRGSFEDILSAVDSVTTSSEINATSLANDFIALNYKQRQLISRVIKVLPDHPESEKVVSMTLTAFAGSEDQAPEL